MENLTREETDMVIAALDYVVEVMTAAIVSQPPEEQEFTLTMIEKRKDLIKKIIANR